MFKKLATKFLTFGARNVIPSMPRKPPEPAAARVMYSLSNVCKASSAKITPEKEERTIKATKSKNPLVCPERWAFIAWAKAPKSANTPWVTTDDIAKLLTGSDIFLFTVFLLLIFAMVFIIVTCVV